MDRRDFIQRLGYGASMALFGIAGLAGCSPIAERKAGRSWILNRGVEATNLAAFQSDNLALEDLVTIIKRSPEFQRIHQDLRDEKPTAAWYEYQTDQAALAVVIFTLDVRPHPNKADQFVVLPYAAFFVEHVGRTVIDVAIATVDPDLEHVNFDLFKNKQLSERKKLHSNVIKTLKEAKRKGPKIIKKSSKSQKDILNPEMCAEGKVDPVPLCGGGGGGCDCCCDICGGAPDPDCKDMIWAACCYSCYAAGEGPTCCIGCSIAGVLLCYVPTYCCGCCCY